MNLEQIRIDRELPPMEIQRYLYRLINDLQAFSNGVEDDVVRSDKVDVGNYVGGIDTEYNLSTSSSTPNGTWTTTMPTAETGKYIWRRDKIRFTDGSFTTTAPTKMYDDIYPVGSIYISADNTSPASLFGGTWVQIEDTFLLSAGSTYTAGNTGGNSTHTLTLDEMPSHTHAIWYKATTGNKSWGFDYTSNNTSNVSQELTSSSGIENAGGGQAFDIMPPYLVVYVWKRTA